MIHVVGIIQVKNMRPYRREKPARLHRKQLLHIFIKDLPPDFLSQIHR